MAFTHFIQFGSGTLWATPVPGAKGVNLKSLFDFPFPLNVPCPTCYAYAGSKCKSQHSNKRWSKKQKFKPWFSNNDDGLPHRARIKNAKIQQVTDALDGI
jgi:hypothetical protein